MNDFKPSLEAYDKCQLLMSVIGYDGVSYERVLSSKILSAHYYLVGFLAFARFLDDSDEASAIIADFLGSLDRDTLDSFLPLNAMLAHVFSINAPDGLTHFIAGLKI